MKTRIFLAAIILFSITSCNTVKKENSKIIKGELVHVVYFWLNNPENQEDVLAFEKAIKKLKSKKINSMIIKVVAELDEKDEVYKKVIENVCTKIYMMEAVSADKQTHVIREIKGEITRAVGKLKG